MDYTNTSRPEPARAMSFIKSYFWPPKPAPVQDPQEKVAQTIQRLKASLGTLTSREISFQRDIQTNRDEAKARLKLNDAANAGLYLQRVKLLEKNLSDTISNKFSVSAQISTLQNSSFTNQIITNMEETRATFRAVSQNRSPEYVQSLAADLTEEMDKAALIQSAISGPLVGLGDVSGDLSLLQAEIDHEREVEQDAAWLDMPPAPVRVPEVRREMSLYANQAATIPAPQSPKRRVAEQQQRPVGIPTAASQTRGPRVIKVVDGQVRDSSK